ncbi:peptidoglycan DD-metalloendopeptidase family protein, partial [Streptomyces sp. bgisy153]|uniref:peptidoglycan DD-metalloendopeptidase family protein n=1 Tax=Streptomyces sp. bgisy153 TaxID=3413793 RepID=UPI003D7391E7
MAGDLDIVGTAAVDVVPIAPNFHTKLQAIVLPAANRVGEEAGRRLGDAMSHHIVVAIPDAVTNGGKAAQAAATRQGDNTGGSFARSLRAKLERAFKAMPKLDVRLGDTGVDAELARIRAKLEQLSNKRVGIDIDAATARAQVERLEAELLRLGAAHPNVAVRVDTAAARAALVEIKEEIDAATAGPHRIRIETDGSLGARLRAAVREAEASLPNVNIDADTTPAQVEVARLRAQLTAMRDVRIGIDMDAATALARVEQISARLQALQTRNTDVDVRVDSAAALAQLAAVRAAVDAVDDRHVDLDTSSATSGALGLAVALGGVIALPAIPPIVAGIGALAAALTAASAAAGAFALAAIPAIKGVATVIQAKSAAEKEAAASSAGAAAADNKAASSALQMASAQQALTAARRNAARSIAQANRRIEDAERALGQAAARAMDERRQAAEAVERAERSLADAKKQSRDAEQSLTQARRDAAQQLADLNDKLTQSKLDERDAALRVQEAEQDLNKTRADYNAGRATELQLQRAQLAYDQAVEAAKQQKKDFAQLQKDAEAAKKAGVDGNEDVKRAADQLADAQQNVRDQVEAVAEAHRSAARAEVQAAQSVADAQRAVSDAVENAANTQVQAAESIASAERGVESARLSAARATATGTTKADEYRQALAKLTPEQRALYDALAGPTGLTAAFKAWSKELQPDVLPLFTRGVNGAKSSLPTFTPLVLAAADAIGTLMDRASADLKRPFWQGFKADIQENAEPAIVGLGVAFGNVLKGMAGIVDAFLPHMDGISSRVQTITGRFANWGANLKGSPEFESFLAYVKETAPGVAEFLGDLFGSIFDLAKALEPMSQVSMAVLSPLLDGLSWISENVPEVVQILWGLYAVNKAIEIGMKAFGIAMGIYNTVVALATIETWSWAAAIQATGIVPLIELIVVAVAALALGVIWAYKNVGWFRTAVDASWKAIRVATDWLWTRALKPFFGWFSDIVVWLWEKVIKPYVGFMIDYWKLVGDVILWLWRVIIKPTIDVVVGYFKFLADVVVWLWKGIFSPIFGFIGALIAWWYKNIVLRYFTSVIEGARDVGDGFVWLHRKAVKPAIEAVVAVAKWAWEKGIKPAFDNIRSAAKLVGDAFGSARDAVKKHWYQVAKIAAKPVNFVIEWVYNKGIKAVFDKVAGFVGMDPLPKGPKLLDTNPKFLAAGGTVGDGWGVARPMKTNKPTAIVGEGDPRYPEYVIPTDPKYRGRAKSLWQAAGVQLLEDGGVLGALGGAWDWTKDQVSSVAKGAVDWAKTGVDL